MQGTVVAFLPPLRPGAGCSCAPPGGDPHPGTGSGSRCSEHRACGELVVCRVPVGTGSRVFTAGACSPSPCGIVAALCVVPPARRPGWLWLLPAHVELAWGSLGWIWVHGSTRSLVGGRESHSSAARRDAEPGPATARLAHWHPQYRAVTAARLAPTSPSTQNHPNPLGSTYQAMPCTPVPQRRHPCLAIAPAVPPSRKSRWLPTCHWDLCRAVPCRLWSWAAAAAPLPPRGQAAIFLL